VVDRRRYWVELRVHGVSGTPPEELLDAAHVRQVAGDEYGRVFRPVDSSGRERRPLRRRHVLEGYHWGQFTSGSWRMGLWLVLIPFGLVNAAAFMLPEPGDRRLARRAHMVAGALIRAIGIGQTCTFALVTAVILVDLVAWQSASTWGWLAWAPAGVLMAAGLLAAVVVMFGLSLLGNQSRHLDAPSPGTGALVDDVDSGLCHHAFYQGNPDAPILNRLHLAAGLGTVAVVGVITVGRADVAPYDVGWLALAGLVVGAASLLTIVLGDPERSVSGSRRHAWHSRLAVPLSHVLVVTALVIVGLCATTLSGLARSLDPVELDRVARWLPITMAVAVAALLAANGVLAWCTRAPVRREFRRYAGGLAAWAAATTGLSLGVGYSGAFALGSARALGAEVPGTLVNRIAYAWGLSFGLIAVIGVLGLGYATVSGRRLAREATSSYGRLAWPPLAVAHMKGVPDFWLGRVGRASGLALLKTKVPHAFVTCAVVSLLMTLVTAWEMFYGELPGALGWLSSSVRGSGSWSSFVADVGSLGLIAAAGWLLVLGRRSLRSHETRRGVNVVWDVVSFWPHSAHPFVPPAYSQFAVPGLLERIRFHLGRTDVQPARGAADAVVVGAHSQGSLIAFAAALWLGDDEIAKVGLVTHGSQLQVAFPRAFPGYVDAALVERLYRRLDGRWVNLYRETDPIAGPVLSWPTVPPSPRRDGFTLDHAPLRSYVDATTGRRVTGNDWRLLDPAVADLARLTQPVARMGRHSGFPSTADWRDAVRAVNPMPARRRRRQRVRVIPAPRAPSPPEATRSGR
jgi:hypothetical protein